MAGAVKKKTSTVEEKRMSLKEKFGHPQFIMEQMTQYFREGDIASITDLISAYISNSQKYSNQEEFANAIGTTRQTLHRMLSHDNNVSLKVFLNAVERIHKDANLR